MKYKYAIHITLILLLSFNSEAWAQTPKAKAKILAKAEYYFDLQMYAKAVPLLQKYLNEQEVDSSNQTHFYKLAISHKKQHQYTVASKILENLVSYNQKSLEYHIDLCQTLIKTKSYEKATQYLKQYLLVYPNDPYAINLFRSIQKIPELKIDNNLFIIENLNINTEQSDFGSVPFGNGIVFSSSGYENTYQKKYARNNEHYLDLYYSEQNGHNEYAAYSEPQAFSMHSNSKFHDGPVHFFDNEKQYWLTANMYRKGDIVDNKILTNILGLYLYQKEGDDYKFKQNFKFNRKGFSVGHAFVSKKLKMLFFISDKPGGYGGTDIYVCRYKDGQWSNPANLGHKINTSGNEMFPFVIDNQLYFSSDGHIGIGGLDIFVSDFDQFFWSYPVNLKAPINSEKDDFAYYLSDKNENKGYFSSNRDGGKGGDDIYFFKSNKDFLKHIKLMVFDASTQKALSDVEIIFRDENGIYTSSKTDNKGALYQKLNPFFDYEFVLNKTDYHTKKFLFFSKNHKQDKDSILKVYIEPERWLKLEGTVAEKNSKTPIDSANVRLNNLTYKIYTDVYTNAQGKFEFSLDPNCKYQVFINKQGYFNEEVKQLSTYNISGSKTFKYDLLLDLDKIELGKAIVLKNIYYDTDRWNIKANSKIELNKVVEMLQNNPYIKIELSSHTDSRASDKYNMILSKKRAKSAFEYIISKGISPDRVQYEGYGEKQLQNHCSNGIECTEKEHQANRRTEIKVIEY